MIWCPQVFPPPFLPPLPPSLYCYCYYHPQYYC
uniref:Uncharacterized protein n=1 Tax=Anguilla anguilla TaxID=7936 RepID=A0A0E9SMT4_ANGAN